MDQLRRLCGSAAVVLALAAANAVPALAAQSEGSRSVQAQLREALDILAIQQLLGDYTIQIDARDYAAYSALFADEGELIFSSARAKGPAAIRKVMEDSRQPSASGRAPPDMRHLCTNIVIHVQGDHATAHSRWTALAADGDGKIRVGGAGTYEDRLVRQGGQWKFQRRIVYGDFPFRDPLAPK